jgi:hypothetical protein
MHEDNKASFVLFGVGIDVCLEVLVDEGSLSSSKPIAFIC